MADDWTVIGTTDGFEIEWANDDDLAPHLEAIAEAAKRSADAFRSVSISFEITDQTREVMCTFDIAFDQDYDYDLAALSDSWEDSEPWDEEPLDIDELFRDGVIPGVKVA